MGKARCKGSFFICLEIDFKLDITYPWGQCPTNVSSVILIGHTFCSPSLVEIQPFNLGLFIHCCKSGLDQLNSKRFCVKYVILRKGCWAAKFLYPQVTVMEIKSSMMPPKEHFKPQYGHTKEIWSGLSITTRTSPDEGGIVYP